MDLHASLARLESAVQSMSKSIEPLRNTDRKTRAVGDPAPTAADLDAIQRAIAGGVRQGIRDGLADLQNEVGQLRTELQAANRLHAERLGSGLQKINGTLAALLPATRKSATNPLPAAPQKPPPGAKGS